MTVGKMCGEYGMHGREENLEERLEWKTFGRIILKGILHIWMEGVDCVSD